MSFVTIPGRTLSPDEIQRYHDDGVVMIKQAIDPNWLRLIEADIALSLAGDVDTAKNAAATATACPSSEYLGQRAASFKGGSGSSG